MQIAALHTFAYVWGEWTWLPSITIPLATLAILYTLGWIQIVRHNLRRNVQWHPAICFLFGWTSLLIALDSTIHELGEQLFWVHMTQHEILVLVSAPLLVLSEPFAVILWSMPRSVRRRISFALHSRTWIAIATLFTGSSVAWGLHAAALWLWHIPAFFEATLHSDLAHGAQHLSFFSTAALFWWSLMEKQKSKAHYGASILYLFTTAIHTSFLGMLLTFSAHAWYPSYALTAPHWGLTGLEDQQVGGLIMWVPAGVVLTGIALWMIPKWLNSSESRWVAQQANSNSSSRSLT
jgi:cytochrome c oxidase assembly factor CtaG